MLILRVARWSLAGTVLIAHSAWPQGMPVGPEFRVNTFTTGAQDFARAAADSLGGFVVTWNSQAQDGSQTGVFAQRYADSGAPVGPELRVNTYTTGSQLFPAVAADPSGGFVIVWGSLDQDGSSWGVFGQRYSGSGSPLGTEFRVNASTTGAQGNPGVAVDAAGNAVVVWSSAGQDGSVTGIYGQRYASSGIPVGPEFRVNAYTTGPQDLPSVASAPSGDFVVVWRSMNQDGSGYGIFGQRYAASGGPLGPEFQVNTFTNNQQLYSQVAADSTGGFVVVWISYAQDGSNFGIFGQRFASSGAPAGPEFQVNTFTTGFQTRPSVAADAAGNFVVAWDNSGLGSTAYWIAGQRYSASGAPSGTEFRINTFTGGHKGYPSVASDAAGNFVVAWQNDVQDGSLEGVFGQRFAGIFPAELIHFRVE